MRIPMQPDDTRLISQSMRIPVAPSISASEKEPDADAAAGGCRRNAEPAVDRGCSGRWSGELNLPIPARGASSIACAGLVQLERSLSDTAFLQSRALAAIERIAKQQAALRRFPIACPACGTLNTPQGVEWGVGDLAVCQGCGQTFVPLGHGLQDSDLMVLRTAVRQLRTQAERVQYLEQIVKNKTPASPSCSGRATAGNQQHNTGQIGSCEPRPASPPALGSHISRCDPSPRRHGNAPREEDVRISPLARTTSGAAHASASPWQQRGDSSAVFESPGGAGGEAQHAIGSALREEDVRMEDVRLSPLARTTSDAAHASASPWHASSAVFGSPGGAGGEAQLMSLLDTHDLMTNSSSSSATPCFHGQRLRQNSFDTEQHAQQAQEAVQAVAAAVGTSGKAARSSPASTLGMRGRARHAREDGEITSASDSESIRSRDFQQLRPQPALSPVRGADSSPVPRSRLSPKQSPKQAARGDGGLRDHISKGGASHRAWAATPCADSPVLGSGGVASGPQRVARHLGLSFFFLLVVRAILHHVAIATEAGPAAVPALLSALFTGFALASFRVLHQEFDVARSLETETTTWAARTVCFRIGGPKWTLWNYRFTLEEACGYTCVLLHVALFCFFENWGLYGPQACRWVAVVAHAIFVGLLTISAQHLAMQYVRAPGPSDGVGVVWMCIAVGTWVTTSWAALTWWRVAVATAPPSVEDTEVMFIVRVPALALAGVQLVNFWMARKAQQPELLSACVVLGGISMAGSCFMSQGAGPALPAWMSAIYLAFCGLSAGVLWQELIRSL